MKGKRKRKGACHKPKPKVIFDKPKVIQEIQKGTLDHSLKRARAKTGVKPTIDYNKMFGVDSKPS